MSLDGEGIVFTDELRPRQSANALEKLLKALCSEGADLDEDTLSIAKKDVGESDRLFVSGKRDSAVYCGYSLVAEGIYLLAEKVLKPKKAGRVLGENIKEKQGDRCYCCC